MTTNKDNTRGRGQAETEAIRIVDQLRLGGVTISKDSKRGVREKIREILSTAEKIEIHQRYEQGEFSDDVARILLGDSIREIERERAAFEAAAELDRDGLFQR